MTVTDVKLSSQSSQRNAVTTHPLEIWLDNIGGEFYYKQVNVIVDTFSCLLLEVYVKRPRAEKT